MKNQETKISGPFLVIMTDGIPILRESMYEYGGIVHPAFLHFNSQVG